MAGDTFVDNLHNHSKSERSGVIQDEIESRWKVGGRDGVFALLDNIRWKGKKWEQQIVLLVQTIITKPHTSPELTEALHSFLDGLARSTLVVQERDTGLQPENLEHVLGSFSQFHWHSGLTPQLNVEFRTPHAYVYGLCAIAAWTTKHHARLTFRDSTERVMHFLERSGVTDVLSRPEAKPFGYDTQTIFGFTRIDPGQQFETDTHAGRLVRLFRQNSDISDSSVDALSIAFAELIENAVKHGEITSPAWLFANVHPQPRIMHVCICDCGIGVRESFRRSSNLEIQNIAEEQLAWIRHATNPLITSKSHGHAGYGLYVVRELLRRNGGMFVFLSGNAAFRIRPQTQFSLTSEVETIDLLPYSWQGTFVGMQFHLDRSLELGPIYDTLPTPMGLDEDDVELDLFDD